MYTYLLINILTLLGPMTRSFEKRIQYYKYWLNSLLPAIAIPFVIFVIWDIIFTKIGVWWFNEDYITGIHIANLPLEECLFFITIPFACIFIYEVYVLFRKKVYFAKIIKPLYLILAVVLITIGLFHLDKLYTSITFIATGVFNLILVLWRSKEDLADTFVANLISLIPFLIVNGILTAKPVVIYDNTENLARRIYTIPVEDSIYMMLLLSMNITIYQVMKKRALKRQS